MTTHTPKVLDIILTAAADCAAQDNTAASNELLDAAGMAGELLDSLIEIEDVLGRMNEAGEVGHSVRLNRAHAAIAKAGGDV